MISAIFSGQLGIKGKMLGFGAALSAITLTVGGGGYYAVNKIVAPYEQVVNESSVDLTLVMDMLSSIRQGRAHVRSLGIAKLTLEESGIVHKTLAKALAQIDRDEKAYEKLHVRNSEAIEAHKIANENWQKEKLVFTEIAQIDASTLAGQKRIDQLVRTDIALARPVGAAFEKLSEIYVGENKANVEQAHKSRDQGIALLFTLVTAGIIIALLLAYLFARAMAQVFLRISEELAESANEVSLASQQISMASQQLSSGATEAAASLEETVASIEELSSVVKLNASHAGDAATFSDKTHASAESGDVEIRKLVVAVGEISQSSKKIEEIINVIDDIAFQTNLLALNAAVEAARAGEQGKGFAVVAEAVRTLAQRSSAAAKDISSLIKDSVSRSEHGAKMADRSGTVLKEIVVSVQKITALNSEIASGSQEQSTGLSQISQAMNQLDQATQGNAASAEEVAATSEQMAQQAQSMHQLVRDLRVLIHGGRGDSASSHWTSKAGAQSMGSAGSAAARTPASTAFRSSFNASPKQNLAKKTAAVNFGKNSFAPKSSAAQVIPFDDDEPSYGKVGSTDGF